MPELKIKLGLPRRSPRDVMRIVDFALLTGLLEEFEVVRNIFPPLTEHADNANVWYRATITAANQRAYEIVVAFQDAMGPLEALDLTAKVMARWNPAFIILAGIAGSFDSDVRLGDVVVSQQVFYYDPGKAMPGRIEYRPQGYPCSTVLVRQTEAIRVDPSSFKEWQDNAEKSATQKAEALLNKKPKAQARLRAHRPKVHFGTVASGSLVVADPKKKADLLKLHGKIIATEMEGAGMLHATFRQEIPTPAVVIKGISDTADKNKALLDAKGYWRELAKENSVRLVLGLIKRGRIRPLKTDQFSLDLALGSPAEAMLAIKEEASVGTSFLAFPRLVLPSGPLTELRLKVKAEGDFGGIHGDLEVRTMVLKYRDRHGKPESERVSGVNEHKVEKVIWPEPIAVYIMLRGKPGKITFEISSFNITQIASWSFE